MATKQITFDGLPVEVTDAAEAVIRKLEGLRDAALERAATAERAVNDAKAETAVEQGKVVALEKAVTDAAITPDKLAKMVADRAALVDTAKLIDANIVTDGLTDAEIQSAAVKAKLGDKAPTDAAQIAGAFSVLASQVEAKDGFRKAVEGGVTTNDADKIVEDAHKAYLDRLLNPLKADA